jgi:iron complex transport system ATP-binding protein
MSGAPIVEAKGMQVALAGRVVVEDLSFSLEPGELVALLGPNGAGKTSLLRALAGLAPARGGLRLFGRDAADLPRAERARRLAYLAQAGSAAWPMSGREIAALGRLPHGARAPLVGRDADAVERALAAADALAFANRPATQLSGGERARVLLARALAVEADLLLCDEPVAALDPAHQLAVMEALRREAAAGRAVVVVMHDVGLALRACGRMMLMRAGRLIADRPTSQALADDALRDAFGVGFVSAQVDGVRLVAPKT